VVIPSGARDRSPIAAIALDDSRLFDTWDRAVALARPWRELALLESASGIPIDELARLTIGERDRLLLALRIGTFGNRLECETRCPSCETRLELSFDASSLMVPATPVKDSDLEIAADDWAVRFRLPDSYDVAAALEGEDLATRLLGSAVESSTRTLVAERIAELDPQANISLSLDCAACGHEWESQFDPASFLFREVESYVGRLTNQVHLLARAYAWSEQSILSMGATRRRRYLDLVTQ
jgi:hypothetical protein